MHESGIPNARGRPYIPTPSPGDPSTRTLRTLSPTSLTTRNATVYVHQFSRESDTPRGDTTFSVSFVCVILHPCTWGRSTRSLIPIPFYRPVPRRAPRFHEQLNVLANESGSVECNLTEIPHYPTDSLFTSVEHPKVEVSSLFTRNFNAL